MVVRTLNDLIKFSSFAIKLALNGLKLTNRHVKSYFGRDVKQIHEWAIFADNLTIFTPKMTFWTTLALFCHPYHMNNSKL